MLMECPNCRVPVQPYFVHCKQCGAKLTDSPPEEPLEYEQDDNWNEAQQELPGVEMAPGAFAESERWQFSREEGWVPTPHTTAEVPAHPLEEIHWGGFWRRCAAFIIDVLAIGALAAIMSSMAYVGYKVGLAAHDRTPDLDNSAALIVALTFATALMATIYFVMLHSISGKTIGKSLFHLRVVGADHERITYGRAFLRWIATVFTGPLVVGILWILWSSEKRSWHDFIAGTWVMRS